MKRNPDGTLQFLESITKTQQTVTLHFDPNDGHDASRDLDVSHCICALKNAIKCLEMGSSNFAAAEAADAVARMVLFNNP